MNKRIIILVSAAVLLVIGLFLVLNNNEPKRYVRSEAHSIEAQDDLEAMGKALKIMRNLPCDNPLSWYYQGAMHWIPDTINNNQLCSWYGNVSQIKDGWDNCTHTPSGKEKLHFLVWHRLYIWHFEKIIRKLSGYQDFALPYWGYTNQDSKYKVLPDIFRNSKSSLYEPCRFDSLNNGYPVSGEIERSLDLTKLYAYKDYALFSNNINAAPHGAMHDYIGAGNDVTGNLKFNNTITGTISNTGLMGWVPTAAFDPIFWLHHSNIDRVWQQWTNSPNGKAVMLQQLKDAPWQYVFFDENGKRVEYTVEEALDIVYGEMDYDFDDTKLTPKTNPVMLPTQYKTVVAESNEKVAINSQITDAVTQLKHGGQISNKVLLTITVSYTKTPKGSYEVYVNKPSNISFHPSNKHFAGYMTFFGSDHKMPGKSCENGCCRPLTKTGRPTFTFEYEIPANEFYTIKVYKHSGKHSGDLIIENITIKQ